jgi:hypothetical protein
MQVSLRCATVALLLYSSLAIGKECPSAGEKDAAPCVILPPGTVEGYPPPLAAWLPGDGFRLRSANGNYRLRIGTNLAIKYEPLFEPSPLGNDWNNFPLTFVRLYLDGNLFRPWIRFWIQVDFRSVPPTLLDALVEIEPWSFFGVRAGLQYTPISRHEMFGPAGILFPEWAVTSNYFWTGFERGITAYGHTRQLEYWLGFYDGTSTRQATSVPGNFVLVGRLTINPLGPVLDYELPYIVATAPVPFRFGFTLQGDWARTSITESNLNPSNGLVVATPTGVEQEQALAAADFVFQAGRMAFLSEFYYRHVSPTGVVTPSFHQLGAWAQVGVAFYRRILVGGLRFNWIQPDTDLPNDQMFKGEVMLAWWIAAPFLSLKARYDIGYQQDPGPPPPGDPNFFNFVVIPLARGISQLGTLQLTVTL